MECMIYLSDDCNLCCNYCYEGNHKRKRRISDATIEHALDFIVRVNSDKEINLTFLGGEPMLNKEMLYFTVDLIKDKYDIPFHYSITTNGTCCSFEDIDFMHKNNFEISLSIDGTKKTHEMNRRPKNEGDNNLFYQKIIDNLSYMIEKNISFTVRMTATCNNVSDLYNNILYFFAMGVKKFDIAFNEFEDWGVNDLKELEKQCFKIDAWFLDNIHGISYLNMFE